MEDKAKFIEAVGQALHDYSRESVVKVEYMEITHTHDGETYTKEVARITFKNGYQKDVNVSCCSCIAILYALYEGLL